MARKIIQIALCGHNETMMTQSEFTLFALCDDGEVFFITNRELRDMAGWSVAPSIPQTGLSGAPLALGRHHAIETDN